MKHVLGLALLAMMFNASYGQHLPGNEPPIADSASSTITIVTNVEGAHVFLNSDSIGVTPLTRQVTPGRHVIRIIPPDIQNWLSDIVQDTVLLEPSTERTLNYSLNERVLLLSTPSGAKVISGDSVLGTTPLVVKSNVPSVRISKQGFDEVQLELARAKRGILATQLRKTWGSNPDEATLNDSDERGSPIKVYLAGAATLIAGTAAAYLKVKADNRYGDYLQTGNQETLSQTDRLDTAAGIALAATQLSLGLFTYFILTE